MDIFQGEDGSVLIIFNSLHYFPFDFEIFVKSFFIKFLITLSTLGRLKLCPNLDRPAGAVGAPDNTLYITTEHFKTKTCPYLTLAR